MALARAGLAGLAWVRANLQSPEILTFYS